MFFPTGTYLVTGIRVEEPMESVIVQRNTISNFANYGLGRGGNGAAVIKKVDITGNTSAIPPGSRRCSPRCS